MLIMCSTSGQCAGSMNSNSYIKMLQYSYKARELKIWAHETILFLPHLDTTSCTIVYIKQTAEHVIATNARQRVNQEHFDEPIIKQA